MAEAWRLDAGLIGGRIQVSGCGASRSRLRGVLLGLAQLGHRSGKRDEPGHEHGVTGQFPGQHDHPGSAAQLVPVVAAPG